MLVCLSGPSGGVPVVPVDSSLRGQRSVWLESTTFGLALSDLCGRVTRLSCGNLTFLFYYREHPSYWNRTDKIRWGTGYLNAYVLTLPKHY